MAQAARKLQREIETVLKKVDDGIVEFERLWDKVYSADTASQKEKYEGELKGQIKKLQRLRESVKNWVSQGAVRDPHRLQEARHRVEQCMERFKVCERETKLKEYSKEALNAYRKKDPLDARKYKAKEWIDRYRHTLEDQLEEYEDELSSLMGRAGRRRQAKQERVEELEHWVERHRYHISSLKKLWNRLRKNAADLDVVESLEEEVEYYVEQHQDEDFYEDEALYDRLDEEDLIPNEDDSVDVDELDEEIVEKLGLTKERELKEQQEQEAAEAAEREKLERERLERERREKERKEREEAERLERERLVNFLCVCRICSCCALSARRPANPLSVCLCRRRRGRSVGKPKRKKRFCENKSSTARRPYCLATLCCVYVDIYIYICVCVCVCVCVYGMVSGMIYGMVWRWYGMVCYGVYVR
ncbi:MAG: hypothetical protein MHM6MM_008565 [Cercozoa sp. M6MM]